MSDTNWTRSSFWREGDQCIEVCRDGGAVRIRDGELGDDSRELVWSVERWAGLLGALTRGEDTVEVLLDDDGGDMWFGARGDDSLLFTAGAWNSFVAGVKAGEFDVEKLSTPPVPVSEGSQVSGEEVGPAEGRPNLAATGAGGSSVLPVPVVAQPEPYGDLIIRKVDPRYFVEEAPPRALLALEVLLAAGDDTGIYISRDIAYIGEDYEGNEVAYQVTGWDPQACALVIERRTDLDRAILPHLSDDKLAWGSGPLVDHNPEPVAERNAREGLFKCERQAPHKGERHTGSVGSASYTWGYVPRDDELTAEERAALVDHNPETLRTQREMDADLYDTWATNQEAGTGSADPDGGQR